MRQPGATYPSDEVRLRIKPHVRVNHSITNHPRFAAIVADEYLFGVLVRLWLIASRQGAAHTGNNLTLSRADVAWITARSRRDIALTSLQRLADVAGYSLQHHGDVSVIHIRNFARKQNIAPQRGGVAPHAPHTSSPPVPTPHSPTKEKKHATHAPEPAPEDSVSPEEIVEGWRTICVPRGLPDVREITASRRTKLRTRIREHPTFEWWNQVFVKIQVLPAGSFFFGNGKSTWKGSLDWLIENERNALKVLEGNYDTTH